MSIKNVAFQAFNLSRKVASATGLARPARAILGPSVGKVLYRLAAKSDAPVSVNGHTMYLATKGKYPPLRMALGLDRVHVIGHSWGGLLAMQYAIQHGEHLRSLVLLNSMSASAEQWRAEEAALAQLVTTEVRAELDSIRASDGLIQGESDAIRQMLIASFKMAFYDQASIDRLDLYVPPDYNDRSRQFSYMVDDLMNFDLFDRLAGVTTPTLIVYGAAEPAVRISGPALNEAIENSELVIIERTGHFPFIERPEATLDVIRSFLSESPIER